MKNSVIDYTKINGWGIDADPENEPTYPIKQYTGDDHRRSNWERPPQQVRTVEILKSTERPEVSAVFGTPVPPQGLSGVIRRAAYTYSESMNRRWLLTILADRINVTEGWLSDFLHARIPNWYKERGLGMVAKHKPGLFIRKILLRAFVLGVVVATVAWIKKNQE